MTDELELTALDGTTPLGFLAALGVLDGVHRAGRDARLRWAGEIEPVPLLRGVADGDELVSLLDKDREQWRDNSVLRGPGDDVFADIKPQPQQIRVWAGELQKGLPETLAATDLFCALLSEGAVDGNSKGKPTHLHFTAGQQKFLVMVRELAANVDADRLSEAVFGPWRADSPLPSLSWYAGSDRVYALRAVNPSNEKRWAIPGADWLAFVGLSFYPTRLASTWRGLALETTACDSSWKPSAFRWPLWTDSLDRDTVRSVVALPALVGQGTRPDGNALAAWGIDRVLAAPIHRNDQGGYGSFKGSTTRAMVQPEGAHR